MRARDEQLVQLVNNEQVELDEDTRKLAEEAQRYGGGLKSILHYYKTYL